MKKVRFSLDYHCYPIWIVDEVGVLIQNGLPIELAQDEESVTLINGICEVYDSLFENSEYVFEYVGFESEENKRVFIDKLRKLIDLVKNKVGQKYIIENKIDFTEF